MLSDWNEFLRGQTLGGAAVDPAAARAELVLADLSHWGLIAFAGDEAQTFLHSQVTNDLRGLGPERAVFAGYCSAKGRMLANFLVFKRDGDILVMLPETLREAVRKRLAMFILRSKVTARDANGDWVRLGLSGPGAGALLADALATAPGPGIMAMAHTEAAFAIRLGDERFDIFVRPGQAPDLWRALAARARAVAAPVWDWLMVDAGIPAVVPATQDQFVPQMANMIELGGVSFQKGCYPGQEIVARSQYLGTQKRRLYLAHVESEVQPGEPVYSPAGGDQPVGQVANAAAAPGGGYDVLAVLQISAYESGAVHLGKEGGPALAFRPLAYMG
ncbi:YgfZ/GcvT domain-containing protein [Parasulfuritortus cantonensis]|nr:folate-binding protein YgfZ [Parasulfuritortus cantonensis]